MTRPPFGFSVGDGDEQPDLGAMLHQLGDLLSGQSGPVNWQVARQGAMAQIGADAGTTAADTAAVTDALRLADVWLDPSTSLPSGVTVAEAWSRRRWLEATQPAWARLVEPIATQVSSAMTETMPPEMLAAAGPLMGVLGQVGGLMFGGQLGQALGELAKEVTSASDIGIPIGPAGVGALLPEGITAFADGLDVPVDQVRLFIALREAAHQRLFAHVPWLAGSLFQAIGGYSSGITIDTSRIEELSSNFDPSNPESIQQALSEGLFTPQLSESQQAALIRLETLLALIEGWVDFVASRAAEPHLPSLSALQETMRRRRATGGPAEQTFATLVGLELRPRRLREAVSLWALITERRGIEGRDEVWQHPDLLPTSTDLDDPFNFLERPALPDIDFDELTRDPGESGDQPDA